jgi:hypothetical protein
MASFMGKLAGRRCPIKKCTMKMYEAAKIASALCRRPLIFRAQPGRKRVVSKGNFNIIPVTARRGKPQKTDQ